MQYAVVLGGDHVGDPGLAGIEIVPDLLHVVGLVALGHHGPSHPFRGRRVVDAFREHGSGLHVVFHVLRLQLHVLIFDAYVTIIIYESLSVAEILDDGVSGCRERGAFERALAEHRDRVGATDGVGRVDRIPERERRRIGRSHLLLHPHAIDGPFGASSGASVLGLHVRQHKRQCQKEGKYISELSQKRYIHYICTILQK